VGADPTGSVTKEREPVSIPHHDSLSAELHEVEKQHPRWRAFIARDDDGTVSDGHVYAVVNTRHSGVTLHAPTPDLLDHQIAVFEHEHPRGWAA